MTDEELLAELERKFQAAADEVRRALEAEWKEAWGLPSDIADGLQGLLDDVDPQNLLDYGSLRRPTADPTADIPAPPRTAPDALS